MANATADRQKMIRGWRRGSRCDCLSKYGTGYMGGMFPFFLFFSLTNNYLFTVAAMTMMNNDW